MKDSTIRLLAIKALLAAGYDVGFCLTRPTALVIRSPNEKWLIVEAVPATIRPGGSPCLNIFNRSVGAQLNEGQLDALVVVWDYAEAAWLIDRAMVHGKTTLALEGLPTLLEDSPQPTTQQPTTEISQ